MGQPITSKELRTNLTQGFQEIENCLRQALGAAPDLKITMKLGEIQTIDSSRDALIATDLMAPNRNQDGTPWVAARGDSTASHVVIVSNRVETTHVYPVWTKDYSNFISSEEMKRAFSLSSQYQKLLENPCPSGSPKSTIYNKRLLDLQNEIAEISKHLAAVAAKSNEIYMNADSFVINQNKGDDIPEENKTFRILAHELMHSWGGLEDRYTEVALGDNLMKNFKCVLDQGQIEQIRKNRFERRVPVHVFNTN